MQVLNGNKSEPGNYIKEKIHKMTGDKRLARIIEVCRLLNRHDVDKLIMMNIPLSAREWTEIFKDAVNKLTKIHVPTIYGKAVQIDYENLIMLPEEDKYRYKVLVLEEKGNMLQIADIKDANNFEENELLALVGRHPFVDTLGWTTTKVTFSKELKEVIGIGQKTWKQRGGDFDGDAAMIILLKLPKKYYDKYVPEVTRSTYETSEYIKLPKKSCKAVVSVEFNDLTIPKVDFHYVKDNKCRIYPESISHLQNLETLTGAILMAINIATNYRVKWTKQQLKRNTTQLITEIKQELEYLRDTNPQLFTKYVTIFSKIHPTFLQIITPLMLIDDDIDIEMYQAILRVHIKDKGPSLFGYLEKVFLSVAQTREDIERVLDYISKHQQKVIDMKKAEHSLLDYNEALVSKNKEQLKASELKDLYERWKNVDANWSKNKWKLLLGVENDIIDKLATIVYKICYHKGDKINKINRGDKNV